MQNNHRDAAIDLRGRRAVRERVSGGYLWPSHHFPKAGATIENGNAEEERLAARARADEERKARRAVEDAERKASRAKAEAERKAARAKADAERRAAREARRKR